MENTQIREYLDKYKIISREMLEKHIEELSRNTYVDKDLVFMLVSVLDDEELLSNLFSSELDSILDYSILLSYININKFALLELEKPQKENKKAPQKRFIYDSVESNSKEALQEIYGELANIIKNEKGNYQVNMNRLVEEELEKQEQKVVKDWNSNSTEGVLQHWKELQNEIENNNNPFNYNFDDIKLPKQEGVKTNKNKPQLSILFTQFPKALEAIAKCSEYGHLKYKETDIDYLNYQRVEGGSKTYADAGLRHRLYKRGTTDIESQLPHAYHVAWNALAELELLIKEN